MPSENLPARFPATVPKPTRSSTSPTRSMTMRIVVDSPEPFGPRKPVTIPGVTLNVRSSTAVVVP